MDLDVDTTCGGCGATIRDTDLYCRRCGDIQPAAVAAAPRPEREPVVPGQVPPLLPTLPSRTGLITLVVLSVGLLVLTMPILVVRSVFYGPDDTIGRYFAALRDRDPVAAIAQLQESDRGRAVGPLISAAALSGPGYLPPGKPTIVSLDTTDDDATAVVRYDVGGTTITTTLRLHRGRASNLLDRWRLADGPASVSVAVTGPVQVGGLDLPGGLPEGDGQFLALPGGYVVKAAETPLLTSSAVTAVPGQAEAAVSQRVRPEVLTEVDRQVQAYVDTCARSTLLRPPGCPFAGSSYSFVSPIRWQITRNPKVNVDLDPDGTVTVSTATQGAYRVTGGPGSYDTSGDTGTFNISGTVVANGQTVQFVPNDDPSDE